MAQWRAYIGLDNRKAVWGPTVGLASLLLVYPIFSETRLYCIMYPRWRQIGILTISQKVFSGFMSLAIFCLGQIAFVPYTRWKCLVITKMLSLPGLKVNCSKQFLFFISISKACKFCYSQRIDFTGPSLYYSGEYMGQSDPATSQTYVNFPWLMLYLSVTATDLPKQF